MSGTQCVKVDDDTFYVETVSRQQVNVTALAEQLEAACRRALTVSTQIRAASAAGVGKAAALEAVILTSSVLSDEEGATAFFAALAAARDG
jgi:hypothetical protein